MKRWPMHYSAPDKVNETALPASWEMRMMEKATAPMNRALKKSTLTPIHRTLARTKENAWLCLSWCLEKTKWILFEVFQTFSSSLVATFFFFVYFTLLYFSFLFFDWFIHSFIFWFILFFKLFAIANSFYVGVFMWMSVWSPVGIDTAQLSNKRFPSWDLLSDKYYWRGWGGRQIRATLTYKRLLKKSAFCFNNSTNE